MSPVSSGARSRAESTGQESTDRVPLEEGMGKHLQLGSTLVLLKHRAQQPTQVKPKLRAVRASAASCSLSSKHTKLHGSTACVRAGIWMKTSCWGIPQICLRRLSGFQQHSQTDALSQLQLFISPEIPPGRFLPLEKDSYKKYDSWHSTDFSSCHISLSFSSHF